MKDGFVAIYTAFLLYCDLFLMSRFIFDYKIRKCVFLIPFALYIPLFILALYTDYSVITPIYGALLIIQFVFLKLSFVELNIKKLVLSYMFLTCVNLVIAAVIATVFPKASKYVDVIVNSFCALVCALVCITKIRYSVHQALQWTPKYVMVICAVLLAFAAMISTIISGFQQSMFPDVWNRFLQVLFPFLLLIICTVVPVIFVISISNTKLKSLTADYEQQIRAQAEHYKELAEANYETRRFRHDFNNMRIALEQLYADGEYDRAMELLHRCGEQINAHRPQFDTGNGIADALLTDKQTKAEKQGGSIVFEGMLAPDGPEPTDLCVILGNTLDNAIEACEKLPAQQDKTITVSGSCCSGFLFLTVKNPIGAPVAIKGGSVATTKDNKTLHGFGLYSLNTVVRKYDGTVNLSADDQTFTAEIELSLHPSPKKRFSILP